MILFTPKLQLFVHRLDIFINKLDRFSKWSCVLANWLDHWFN